MLDSDQRTLGTEAPAAGAAGAVGPAADGSSGRGRWGARLGRLLAAHWPLVIVLTGGAVLRAMVVYAYWPAFWFSDDSRQYLIAMHDLRPGVTGRANGIGYPTVLRILSHTHSLAVVAIVQHLAMLVLAAGIYALLRRRGVVNWLAAAATLPTLFDERQLVTEHYVLSDTMFIFLVVSALILLLWQERPGVLAHACVGVLLVAATVTRTVGVSLLAVVALYLLVRWVGWRRLAAFGLTVLVTFGGYLLWNHAETGSFAMSPKQGRFLYSRVGSIADCGQLELTASQRALCPERPLGQRPDRGDYYVWLDPELKQIPDTQDYRFAGFASAVIHQQPLDYAGLIAGDLAKYLLPGQEFGKQTRCLARWSTFPPQLGTKRPVCQPFTASSEGFDPNPASVRTDRSVPLQNTLHTYSQHVRTPASALGLAVLLAVAAVAWRPRRGRLRDGLDSLLLVGCGLALLVVSVATTMFSIRYGVPPLTLIAMGGVLATHRIVRTFR
ncbi:MAG: hypothetical protein ACRDQ5_22720 [Sciscionella sp.]